MASFNDVVEENSYSSSKDSDEPLNEDDDYVAEKSEFLQEGDLMKETVPIMIDGVQDYRFVPGRPQEAKAKKVKNKRPTNRNSFPVLEKKVLGPEGKKVVTFPFLEVKDNLRDEMLFKQLEDDEPFLAPFKTKCNAWKAVVKSLKKKTDKSGQKVYEDNLSVKTIKGRFMA
jgi:hypothetical protein